MCSVRPHCSIIQKEPPCGSGERRGSEWEFKGREKRNVGDAGGGRRGGFVNRTPLDLES